MKNVLMTGMLVAAMTSGIAAAEETQSSLADTVNLSGDIRLRHEYFDVDGKPSRHRQRVRARISARVDVNEQVKGEIRAASGEDDPTSTNQSFDDAFTTKGLQLDLAYLDWAVADGVNLIGGKMKKPWMQVNQVVWDGDLNPEGFAAKLKSSTDAVTLMANGGLFWIDELSSTSEDIVLYVAQVGLEKAVADGINLQLAGSIYQYENVKAAPVFVESTDAFGNDATVSDPVTGDLVYDNDFALYEGIAQLSLKVGDTPVKLFGNYVVNGDALDDDSGYGAGFKVGKAKTRGQVEFKYLYRDVEANAVLGVFSDSDFAGGGAGNEGHKIQGKLAIADNWMAGATLYLNSIDPDGADTDYTRLQLNLIAKF